jgi:N-acetylmuramoyl-L-alanine amidase
VVRRLPALLAVLAIAFAVAPDASAGSYRVRWGDSLTSIATRYHTSVRKLARANHLDPTHYLLAGTTIRVPGATSGAYRVRVGDTLSGLAARFGTSVSALAAANHLDPNGLLFAGITLRLPGSGPVSYSPASYSRPTRSLSGRYRVQPGDSLGAIASRFGTTVAALAAANRLDPARYLLAGITIAVPGGVHASSAGETRAPLSHAQVRSLIVYWSGRYGVPSRLALALAWMESGYQVSVLSNAGAFGPMQVTPATRQFVEAVLVGTPIAHTTSGDVQVGVVYLRYLLRRFGGDERLAHAGYFQGPEGVRKGLLPATKAYVADIQALESRV